MEREEGHEDPFLAEELLAIDSYGKKGSQRCGSSQTAGVRVPTSIDI